jgi:phenylalanyl-tRNA synthetase beta chain
MRVPESWLRSFVDTPWSAAQIADRLTMAGLEVEDASTAAPPFDGVVVGEVRSVSRHPDADKLSVCEVDAGEGKLRTIVCGAPNVRSGMKVPCAVPGARLPGDFLIRPVRMRGVESQGMLCSARELGLSDDHSGLLELDPTAAAGVSVRALLDLDETIFTLKLTPNLAHCMSVHGVARELAAISGASLRSPAFPAVASTIDDRLPVRIDAPELCGRFSGRIIRGVNAKAPTPHWIRSRLERAGQRSVSALVDISNYVMLELGRPTHVFDLDRIEGGLQVRWARAGERLELLNGQTIELAPDVGVIADSKQVESLAGIMGGESTAVGDDTRNIYVEAAFWWPDAVAGRSRRYNFATDAGARFERGVDPSSTVEHIEYITRLILDVCGGEPGPIDDQTIGVPAREPVQMRTARARKIIGDALSDDDMADALVRLGLPVERRDDRLIVVPPSWRFDLRIEEDLIEEIARIRGYDRLPLRPPRAPAVLAEWPEGRRTISRLKRSVAARDYQEVINYSFVDRDLDSRVGLAPGERRPVELLNPIAAQMNRMRTTLWGGLLETLRSNLNRKASRVRLFEIGRVFFADPAVMSGPAQVHGIAQPRRLALLAYGPAQDEHWTGDARPVDLFDLKGDLETLAGPGLRVEKATHPALHPGRSGQLVLDGAVVGWIGELHPGCQQSLELPGATLLAEIELDPLLVGNVPVYREVSKFPPLIRDIALVVSSDLPAARLFDEIAAAIAAVDVLSTVKRVVLFDEYRGKGLENKEKSLAFRIWMQDTSRTLNDADAGEAVSSMVGWLSTRLGVRLRSGA